jgi:hypothetical protein
MAKKSLIFGWVFPPNQAVRKVFGFNDLRVKLKAKALACSFYTKASLFGV